MNGFCRKNVKIYYVYKISHFGWLHIRVKGTEYSVWREVSEYLLLFLRSLVLWYLNNRSFLPKEYDFRPRGHTYTPTGYNSSVYKVSIRDVSLYLSVYRLFE